MTSMHGRSEIQMAAFLIRRMAVAVFSLLLIMTTATAQDPSDPTQVTFHLMQEFEWTKLSEDQGDQVAYKISPFIPIKLFDQSFLANVEVPLTYAGTDVLGHHTSIGDTRLKLFWLIGTENEFVRAIVPSFDAIAPTGDDELGTGGGSWILMPNIVFALQPAEKLSMYPFFRYVHSDAPQSFLVPDSGIPVPPGGDVSSLADDTRAFNLEWMNVFSLEDAVMDWVTVTPDYFQNFSGSRSHTFTMKYDAGVGLTESLFLITKFWHPVSGEVSNDFTFGFSLDWYPSCN
ncbi:MAG: hypothetical protein ACR2NZ_02235 [Rubripirellula sp.]